VSAVVTVYTTGPSCMACTQTKRHLGKRGIEFTEQPIGDDSQLYAAFDEMGFTSAPVVCANVDGKEQAWDGYRPDRIDALRGAA
jgi:glutaredoxin-like protein NrdH